MAKLKPCRFCGKGEVQMLPSLRFRQFRPYWVIFCPVCYTQTDMWDDAEALTEAWNTAPLQSDLNGRRKPE